MTYDFREIEAKWQKYWEQHRTFKVENSVDMPKFYVLDMFPYPSGAGLHVGHPLGYIASEIFMRALNVIKDLMYYIPKAMIVLDCLRNSMPFKPVNIQRSPPGKISLPIAVNWIKWAFLLTGVVKFVPLHQIITNGRNGFLFNCLNLGMIN